MNPAEAYKNAHVTSLEAHLSRAVTSCMHLRPADPVGYIGVRLISASAVAEPPTTTHPPATEAVASEAARRAIRLGADLARDPAVQRAVAARIGGVPQLEDVSREGETEALRAVVEALASERDDLLRERLETQREALGLDVEGLSLPPTPPEGSEGSADSIEEMFWGPRRERAPERAPEDKDPDEEDDFTFTEQALGAALAVASLVLVVSVARAAKPVLARRAALVAAAAIAGVVAGL